MRWRRGRLHRGPLSLLHAALLVDRREHSGSGGRARDGPTGCPLHVWNGAVDRQAMRTARVAAKQQIARRGMAYRALQAITRFVMLDVTLFGRMRSGPFFALLVKRVGLRGRLKPGTRRVPRNSMRILYSAIDQSVPAAHGGSVHVTAVAEGLAELGHDVHVLVSPGDRGEVPTGRAQWFALPPPLGRPAAAAASRAGGCVARAAVSARRRHRALLQLRRRRHSRRESKSARWPCSR